MDISLDKNRHSTWIEKVTNSSNGFTNLEFQIYEIFSWIFVMIYSSTAKLRKIMYFGPIRSLFSFSTEKNVWKKLVKQIGENIWWICYRIRLFLCIFNRFSLPLVHWSERNMVFWVPISSEGHNFKFLSKLIDDRYQFFSTWNKYFCFKISIVAQHLSTFGGRSQNTLTIFFFDHLPPLCWNILPYECLQKGDIFGQLTPLLL